MQASVILAMAFAAVNVAAVAAPPDTGAPAPPGSQNKTVTIDPAVGKPDEQGTALALAFFEACFQKFLQQDDPAGGKLSTGVTVTPLPAEQVSRYLHNDPGQAWVYRHPKYGDFVITIEKPPAHACGVRRVYPTVPGYGFTLQLETGVWAATEKLGPFVTVPPVSSTTPSGPTTAKGRALLDSSGKPLELFMEVQTRFPDGQVEVRLVRRSYRSPM